MGAGELVRSSLSGGVAPNVPLTGGSLATPKNPGRRPFSPASRLLPRVLRRSTWTGNQIAAPKQFAAVSALRTTARDMPVPKGQSLENGLDHPLQESGDELLLAGKPPDMSDG